MAEQSITPRSADNVPVGVEDGRILWAADTVGEVVCVMGADQQRPSRLRSNGVRIESWWHPASFILLGTVSTMGASPERSAPESEVPIPTQAYRASDGLREANMVAADVRQRAQGEDRRFRFRGSAPFANRDPREAGRTDDPDCNDD
jgi:hypothetical protein